MSHQSLTDKSTRALSVYYHHVSNEVKLGYTLTFRLH
jgi:hypothetical protein